VLSPPDTATTARNRAMIENPITQTYKGGRRGKQKQATILKISISAKKLFERSGEYHE
jgi:hypothetical protein